MRELSHHRGIPVLVSQARALGTTLLLATMLAGCVTSPTETSTVGDPRGSGDGTRLAVDPSGQLRAQALACLDAGNPRGAIAPLEELAEREPGSADTHFHLASALRDCGELESAVPHYRDTVRIEPGHTGGHALLALTLYQLERWQEAMPPARSCLTLTPPGQDRAPFLHLLADCYVQLGRTEESLPLFSQALAVDHQNAELHLQAGRARLRTGHAADAVAPLRQAVRLDPDNPQANVLLGIALMEIEDLEGAVPALDEAARLNPSDPDIHKLRGMVHAAREEWPRAAACYEDAVALAPGDTEALSGLVGSLIAAGDREAARRQNQALQKLDPDAARVFDEALGE